MKKVIALLLSILLVVGLAACGSTADNNNSSAADSKSQVPDEVSDVNKVPDASSDADESVPQESSEPENVTGGKVLVVYYSATGNTENVANYIAAATGGDVFELVPSNDYSSADLDYTNEDSRVCYEHDHPEARDVELVKSTVDNWDGYDTVFIGYPIWWQVAAWPVNGFVKANDFNGKTVIPFCTSASSGLGDSANQLADMATGGNWLEGSRFSSGASEQEVNEWVEGL